MAVVLRASTGAKMHVWRQDGEYHARLVDVADEPQVCLGVDLFEVLAELAGLDLEDGAQCAEAVTLADCARARLGGDGGRRLTAPPG
jgi:hypothetical protein